MPFIRTEQFGYRGIESGWRWGDTWDDRGKDSSDVSTTQKVLEIAGSLRKLEERHGTDSPLRDIEKDPTILTPLFWASASRTVRQQTYTVLRHPLGDTSLLHPLEANRYIAQCLTNAVNNIW